MNGTIKTRHSDKPISEYIKKYGLIGAIAGFILGLGLIIWFTPIRQVMAMGIERVLIYIDECSEDLDVKKPRTFVKDLHLNTVKVEDLSGYEEVIKQAEELGRGNLILVNGHYRYNYIEGEDLVIVNDVKNQSYKLMNEEMRLNKEMVEQLNYMMEDFEACTDKHDMILTSGYRTLTNQKEILQEKINLLGEEEALQWAMLPGYSEHHTGYAVDVSIYTDQGNYIRYRGQDEYSWINQNCYKYGFIRRYAGEKKELTGVSDEEWHYRYIGIPHAHIVASKNFCFEEYIEYLKQFTFDKKHLNVSCEQGEYEIYFVPCGKTETKVPVPAGSKCSILGNNVDGYIVTVEK